MLSVYTYSLGTKMDKGDTLLWEIAKKDPKGAELYTRLLNAKIEFYQYMFPIVTAEIEKSVKGKTINRKHWRSKMFGLGKGKTSSADQPILKKKHKKLLLIFHPDKNPDRIEQAEKFTKILLNWIAGNQKDKINYLLSSDNPWGDMNDLIQPTPVNLEYIGPESELKDKEFFVKDVENTRWYLWDPDIDLEAFN